MVNATNLTNQSNCFGKNAQIDGQFFYKQRHLAKANNELLLRCKSNIIQHKTEFITYAQRRCEANFRQIQ
ncbi:hypothetical protein T07_13271 [Trichinella nelsoni]|uniref:Uncharacterized protein n=1 Tax=Trichinella nelsoni TaxID=6336 RepID=A0A0V0S955_9BILA|nr:hypothetical protein T07_13271 [Trichinella nelsoni]